MFDCMDKITILMSTYNGEKYLTEQIDSILAQTYSNWELVIRDDGSSDGTVQIVDDYVEQEERVRWFDENEDSSENLGPMKSFFLMLETVESPYYMFCDQDDVWLPQKIEITYQEMLEIEVQTAPCLVHTNLIITDSELHALEKGTREAKDSMRSLLLTNDIVGCTVMINKNLRLFALNDLDSVRVMHDMWLGLLAAQFGVVSYIGTPSMLYRQHTGNVVGKTTGVLAKLRILNSNGERQRIQTSINAASSLIQLHGSRLNNEELAYLETVKGFGTEKFTRNLIDMYRNKVHKNSQVATIALIVKLAINHNHLK
ncbi:glycosyltransferase family 2 protein [Lactiplantibacillus plantarum]|nr:glycosyltransferase family 2 protein [Lactiplantibacillus plantarum]